MSVSGGSQRQQEAVGSGFPGWTPELMTSILDPLRFGSRCGRGLVHIPVTSRLGRAVCWFAWMLELAPWPSKTINRQVDLVLSSKHRQSFAKQLTCSIGCPFQAPSSLKGGGRPRVFRAAVEWIPGDRPDQVTCL